MRLQVAQPDTDLASAAVHIYFDQKELGVIGPGGSIEIEIPHDERFPYEVLAVCGHNRVAFLGHKDVALQVRWSLRTHSIELYRTNS